VKIERVLLDMDGVLVDCWGGVRHRHGVDPDPYEDPSNLGNSAWWSDLLGIPADDLFPDLGVEWWAGLDPLPGWRSIVAAVESLVGPENVCILTSPTRFDAGDCYEGKLWWIKRHLPGYERRFMVGKPKQFCAAPWSLLVDDDERNCQAFSEAGGVSLLVPAPWNKLHALDRLEAVERWVGEIGEAK